MQKIRANSMAVIIKSGRTVRSAACCQAHSKLKDRVFCLRFMRMVWFNWNSAVYSIGTRVPLLDIVQPDAVRINSTMLSDFGSRQPSVRSPMRSGFIRDTQIRSLGD